MCQKVLSACNSLSVGRNVDLETAAKGERRCRVEAAPRLIDAGVDEGDRRSGTSVAARTTAAEMKVRIRCIPLNDAAHAASDTLTDEREGYGQLGGRFFIRSPTMPGAARPDQRPELC